MTEGDLVRGLARGLHLAGALSLFGVLVFRLVVARGPARHLSALVWASLGLALAGGLAWLVVQTANMASVSAPSAVLAALPIVLGQTRFGQLLLARLGLLVAAAILFGCGRRGWAVWLALLLAGLADAAESLLGHGAAMGGAKGDVLWAAEALHILAAGAWLGALAPLMLAADSAARLAAWGRRFSLLGMVCVGTILVTALIQSAVLIGAPAYLVTTAYGRVALVKIMLLLGLIGLAAGNRYRLVPALDGAAPAAQPAARARLLASIGTELALGLLVILAAGLLLNLEPPMDMAMRLALHLAGH